MLQPKRSLILSIKFLALVDESTVAMRRIYRSWWEESQGWEILDAELVTNVSIVSISAVQGPHGHHRTPI